MEKQTEMKEKDTESGREINNKGTTMVKLLDVNFLSQEWWNTLKKADTQESSIREQQNKVKVEEGEEKRRQWKWRY